MSPTSLRWAIASYCLVHGALLLVVPHRFAAPAFFGLELHLFAWGLFFLLASVAMVALLLQPARRPLAMGGHLFAGAALLTLVPGLAANGAWTGVAIYLPLALGTALAPLLSTAAGEEEQSGRRDLLTLLLGLIALLFGFALVAGSPHFDSPTYVLVSPYLPIFAVALVGGGIGMLSSQIWPTLTGAEQRATAWQARPSSPGPWAWRCSPGRRFLPSYSRPVAWPSACCPGGRPCWAALTPDRCGCSSRLPWPWRQPFP